MKTAPINTLKFNHKDYSNQQKKKSCKRKNLYFTYSENNNQSLSEISEIFALSLFLFKKSSCNLI